MFHNTYLDNITRIAATAEKKNFALETTATSTNATVNGSTLPCTLSFNLEYVG